jgi:hypothetical protein
VVRALEALAERELVAAMLERVAAIAERVVVSG